jgi:hypothetical protein
MGRRAHLGSLRVRCLRAAKMHESATAYGETTSPGIEAAGEAVALRAARRPKRAGPRPGLARTAVMNVNHRNATPVGVDLVITGELERSDGR